MENITKHSVEQFRRQLVVASYAKAEYSLKSSKSTLDFFNTQYRSYRMQVNALMDFIEGLHGDVQLLFNSTQWKIGDELARTLKRMTKRKPDSQAERNFKESYSKYNSWKREYKSREEKKYLK